MISCGHCCESQGETFWRPSCVAGKIPLSVKDGSCEGASGKCESNPGTLVSCSIQHQLLGPCSSRVSVTDCGWGESSKSDAEHGPASLQFWRRLLTAAGSLRDCGSVWQEGWSRFVHAAALEECGEPHPLTYLLVQQDITPAEINTTTSVRACMKKPDWSIMHVTVSSSNGACSR